MKTAGLIFLLLWAAAAPAQTNQSWRVCRYPVRVFNGHAVNLAPLFQWWERQPLPTNAAAYGRAVIDIDTNAPDDADRPLAAWHRITGTPVGALASGSWLVDAFIYTCPTSRLSARIILNRPPVLEKQNFDALESDLAQANQQITNAQAAYEAAEKARKQDEHQVEVFSRWPDKVSKVASTEINVHSRAAAQDQEAAATAATQKKQLEGVRGQIEAQLKTIPTVHGSYYIDWFAVMLGRNKQGLPIYDLGQVSPTPP